MRQTQAMKRFCRHVPLPSVVLVATEKTFEDLCFDTVVLQALEQTKAPARLQRNEETPP